MKNSYIKKLVKLAKDRFGDEVARQMNAKTNTEYAKLCKDNESDSKAKKKHTEVKIYPCISVYRGLVDAGIQHDEAVDFLDKSYSYLALGKAKAMQIMCKLPSMYKKMPKIFRSVTLKEFGTKQGFEFKFYDTEPTRCKFDMTHCLYADVCAKNNAFFLVKCFCHTDDVTDGNIHPKLCWNRTKTIGEGGDVCDFDLFVVDDDKK